MMNPEILAKIHVTLGSKSPRRRQLMHELGINFTVEGADVEEVYPEHLTDVDVPLYLSQLKSNAYPAVSSPYHFILSADTIVCLDNQIIGKPTGESDARRMLGLLSGKTHRVLTGVTLRGMYRSCSFSEETKVSFRRLEIEEIDFYLKNFQPYDKAGSYGIQEWIGLTGIEKIDGCYFNVMGLPVRQVYEKLMQETIFAEEMCARNNS